MPLLFFFFLPLFFYRSSWTDWQEQNEICQSPFGPANLSCLAQFCEKALRRYAKPDHTHPFCTHMRMRGLGKQLFVCMHVILTVYPKCLMRIRETRDLLTLRKIQKKSSSFLFVPCIWAKCTTLGWVCLGAKKDIGCGYHLRNTYWTSSYYHPKHI